MNALEMVLVEKRSSIADVIELAFPIFGEKLPLDHGYSLFSALTRKIPYLHDPLVRYHMGTVPCLRDAASAGIGRIKPESLLRFRIPVADFSHLLLLTGQRLDVDGCFLDLGSPTPYRLRAYPDLYSRIVIIKNKDKAYMEAGPFLEAVYRQMEALGIKGRADIPRDEAGQPRRRIIRIRDKKIVGFSVALTGLSAEASLRVLALGLGGRGKLGCGFFQPRVFKQG